ncbi:Protein of unknown function [Thermomonospora echinospora]|uniref:DUF2637 domain-containing protein n=1 Tax=Thermomonospora echinospora TaxID=1992 RepID=A0A1H6DX72_9ACTN|nr:DUF2637 domain-containing protein [Thermomonospora echinospora]SEG89868.1 Protein of unknown function [Thermomonospora echinospora]
MTRRVLPVVADSGPVMILAAIAAAGSFTHIRDTAREHGQHGWMAWAVAVCIDLTCVMAARERQRDKRTARATRPLSWPTLVLVGGILLSLAANLAQAEPTVWGWVTAGTPAAAFLVAVSMLERRAAHRPAARPAARSNASAPDGLAVPPSFGCPADSSPSSSPSSSPVSAVRDRVRPELAAPGPALVEDGQTEVPLPAADPAASSRPDDSGRPAPARPASATGPAGLAGPLVEFARRVADEHHTRHGRPITRDALRARLGVSNQLASELLRQIRDQSAA